jgi:hypothetical protein
MQSSNNHESEYLSTASSMLLLFAQGFGIIIHGKINTFRHNPCQNSVLKRGLPCLLVTFFFDFLCGCLSSSASKLSITSIQEKLMCMCNLSISQCYTVAYCFFVLLHVIIIFAEIGIHDLGAVVFLPLMAFVINDSINGVH